ncbi:MAG: UDP-N-acetylmuramate dehydrogenase [Verrucomicrobiota bacterium]
MLEAAAMTNEQHLAELREKLLPGTLLRLNEPLAKRTTLRVGGPAEFFVEPSSESDLARAVEFCGEKKLPLFVLGRGSNLLIKDSGIRGMVISLAHPNFSVIKVEGQFMQCSAGARLKAIAAEARKNNLAGMEFLEGIPGNLGGALRMNAGAMGSAIFNLVEKIRVMDRAGKIEEWIGRDIAAEYRSCPLLKEQIALSALLKGEIGAGETVAVRMKSYSAKRWESQPKEPSAGCIFKNPSTIPAGKLIEELGLKGTSVGGARVSEIHGNFIVNDGGATARDVLDLIDAIKKRVKAERGIDLRTEVEIIGE